MISEAATMVRAANLSVPVVSHSSQAVSVAIPKAIKASKGLSFLTVRACSATLNLNSNGSFEKFVISMYAFPHLSSKENL